MKITSTHLRRSRRSGGFTLLEVIFAMGILAIGLLAVAALLPVAAIQQKRALDDQLGTSFGLSALSTIKAAGRTAFSGTLYSSSTAAPYRDVPLLPAYTLTDPNKVFEYRVCYSIENTGGPMNVAVFVYRKPTNGTVVNPVIKQNTTTTDKIQVADDTTANNRTVIAGTGAFAAPITTAAPNTTYADIYRTNSVVLIVNTSVTPYRAYVARVKGITAQSGTPGYVAPIGDFSTPTDCSVYCLTDDLVTGSGNNSKVSTLVPVAIVQGVIP